MSKESDKTAGFTPEVTYEFEGLLLAHEWELLHSGKQLARTRTALLEWARAALGAPEHSHKHVPSVEPVVTGCEWSTDGESDMWETTCRKAFVFNEDGPIANGFKFCPFCGLSLDELPYLDADE